MRFTNLDDPSYIRLGKTLRNYAMIGYYNILRKLNDMENDGQILLKAGTFNKYWEEKEKVTGRNKILCSKMRVYYKDLGRYNHTIERILKSNSAQTTLKRGRFCLRR